jgi:hypothetical protein
MNTKLNKLIDHMQKGWEKLPRNPTCGTSYGGWENHPTSACPVVHAYLGKTGKVADFESAVHSFPILNSQNVSYYDGTINLGSAILLLADDYHWSTPQVIAWLKTHLDD